MIKTKYGDESDAAFFYRKSKQAVVFVPGFYYSKEDWYFLAERFQQLEIASLSLNGKSALDVLGAIDFLKKKGFEKIASVGGSMGEAAVLSALELEETIDESVDKAVVLAPYGGNSIKSKKIKKLFIVAKEDDRGCYPRVYTLYKDSSEPKVIKEYEGSEHAQALFSGEHREDLIKSIIAFITIE
jgi:esterase/lipase